MPQDSVYDLDVSKSNTASPSRRAPPIPASARPTQQTQATAPAMGTPPPLPKRQANANPSKNPGDAPAMPPIPARGAAPPLPARQPQV